MENQELEYKEKYNTDKLINVVKYGFVESKRYHFQPFVEEKKFLFFTIRDRIEEGFYDNNDYYDECYNNVPEYHVYLDGKVYRKPRVILFYQDDYSKDYYFDSNEEAGVFYNILTCTHNWIE